MKIRYLGTAATEGFPAAFCNCKSCTAARKDISKELRTRSQMLIDTELMIDFPPESYYHAMRFGIDLSAVRTLLVTHSHTDHFYAQEFVNRGYKFAEGIASEFFGHLWERRSPFGLRRGYAPRDARRRPLRYPDALSPSVRSVCRRRLRNFCTSGASYAERGGSFVRDSPGRQVIAVP